MKVLLINSPTRDTPVVRDMAGGLGFDAGTAIVLPPLDMAYMATTLMRGGDEVKIIDSSAENYNEDEIHQIIKEENPEVLIGTVSLPSIYNDCSFFKEVRQYSSARIVVKTGIQYPPLLQEIFEKSSADLCIYGECEIDISKILNGEEKRGTAYFEGNKLKVEENMIISNLDELPFPSRNLLPNQKYRYAPLGDGVTTMQTSRGCPFPCAYYCPYPLVQGRKWRSRSPKHIAEEIEDIVNNHRIKKILFRDANFTFDKARTESICELIIQSGLEFEWWCETRADYLNKDIMRIMKQSGCKGMNIGVETGDLNVMRTQAKVGLTMEKLKLVRNIAKELGLRLHFLLMLGLPTETKKSLYETYKLVLDLKPESIGITFVTPYPGTELYSEAKKKNWIESQNWAKFNGHIPVMHTDNLSIYDLLKAQKMIYQRFFFSSSNWFKRWLTSKFFDWQFKKWASY